MPAAWAGDARRLAVRSALPGEEKATTGDWRLMQAHRDLLDQTRSLRLPLRVRERET
jgi:hypothetical protein